MIVSSRLRRMEFLSIFLWTAATAFLAGCGQNNTRVYSIPKDPQARPPWKLPAGWEERPAGGMRAARFAVTGTNAEADVSIFPFKDYGGGASDVVNLWRGQLQLEPTDDASISNSLERIEVGGGPGGLIETASKEAVFENGARARFLAAMVRHDNTSWFIRISGEDAFVRAQKPAFVEFLRSLNFDALSARPEPARQFTSTNIKPPTPGASTGLPAWTVPPGWKETAPGAMLLAKFAVAGEGGARADVNISRSEGDGGGVLPNINRWRGQLGLAPAAEGDLGQFSGPLDVAGARAILVDMTGTDVKTGQPARVIGAIVLRAQEAWFYKLMGDSALAAREKDSFIRFVQSVQYPHG
jgi:hypothetical protein